MKTKINNRYEKFCSKFQRYFFWLAIFLASSARLLCQTANSNPHAWDNYNNRHPVVPESAMYGWIFLLFSLGIVGYAQMRRQSKKNEKNKQ